MSITSTPQGCMCGRWPMGAGPAGPREPVPPRPPAASASGAPSPATSLADACTALGVGLTVAPGGIVTLTSDDPTRAAAVAGVLLAHGGRVVEWGSA